MSDEPLPPVTLDFETVWCALHLEPFREAWPKGCAIGTVRLFDCFVRDPRTIAAATPTGATEAASELLGRLVKEHSPLCCFVGDDALRWVYIEAGVWTDGS